MASVNPNGRVQASGLTLGEVMVALTISLVLLTGVVEIYLSSKQTYRVHDALSRLQESGRHAMELLTNDIRLAGYKGCASNTPVANTLINGTKWMYFFDNPISGYEGGASTFPAEFSGAVLSGTDAVVVMRADTGGFRVQSHNLNAASIQLVSTHNLDQGEILFISDCRQSSIFQMSNQNNNNTISVVDHHTGNTTTPGNCTKGLGSPVDCSSTNGNPYRYESDAYIRRLVANAYYIGTGASGQPALWRETLLNRTDGTTIAQELVEGIENLQVMYGVDTDVPGDGVADQYLRANEVPMAAWPQVVSMRLGLLVRSLEQVNEEQDTKTYAVAGTPIGTATSISHPNDRRLRYVFTSTIQLRNRGL